MKVALYGASGNIGQRITSELLSRGHSVTAIVRDPSKIAARENLRAVKGDVTDPADVATRVNGHQAVIAAVQAKPDEGKPTMLLDATKALRSGLRKAGVRRLIVVGGAGSLLTGPGLTVMNSPNFPAAWKSIAQAHSDVLDLYKTDKGLDWTYFSPPALIEPGKRTQEFRLGKDNLITDSDGKSHISMEDYAVALVDELENPSHIRERFTIGY